MNKPSTNSQSKWTLPNLLTGFRLASAPVLLWLAWNDYSLGFMLLLACAFVSDFLDGFVARLTGQVTEFGAILDSWADVLNYLTIALGCWWLWPTVVEAEITYVLMIIASCVLPALVGYIKFGGFTSYHTWAVKFAAAFMAFTLYVLFAGGPVWPFRIAAILCVIAAAEEIAISFLLPKPISNVRSVWDVIKSGG